MGGSTTDKSSQGEKKATVQNMMDQTTKPELAKYCHDALFIPKKTSLLKELKQVFLKS